MREVEPEFVRLERSDGRVLAEVAVSGEASASVLEAGGDDRSSECADMGACEGESREEERRGDG